MYWMVIVKYTNKLKLVQIPSFAELLRKSIYRFTKRIEVSSNSIIAACLPLMLYISSLSVNGGVLYFNKLV